MDLEHMACAFYENHFVKEKKLLEEILGVRRLKLDCNFTWTDIYKKQLLELNKSVMEGFSLAYDEAKKQLINLVERIEKEDTFFCNYTIDINLKPFLSELNDDEMFFEERGVKIYNLLYDIIPDVFWMNDIYVENDLEELKEKIIEEKCENFKINEYLEKNTFHGEYICKAMYEFLSQTKHILSWYDILKINEISVEVKVINKSYIMDIGEGIFWENNLQSLCDNEAENLRQEYISRIGKDITGLPVDLFIDEMESWDKIGPYKRIKFHGTKSNSIDFKRIYSISLENNPRILVKDAAIDLTDAELQQVKDFIVKNINFLLDIIKGNVTVIDFARKLGKL